MEAYEKLLHFGCRLQPKEEIPIGWIFDTVSPSTCEGFNEDDNPLLLWRPSVRSITRLKQQ